MRDLSLPDVWEQTFDRWLEPFLTAFGHKVRRKWAPVYVRGLLMPGERKSVEPLAARVAPDDVEQLHHFVATSRWDASWTCLPTCPLTRRGLDSPTMVARAPFRGHLAPPQLLGPVAVAMMLRTVRPNVGAGPSRRGERGPSPARFGTPTRHIPARDSDASTERCHRDAPEGQSHCGGSPRRDRASYLAMPRARGNGVGSGR
jgi:hypothetical protein